MEVEGRTFTTPAVGERGTMVHKHLGFHLDQKLTGSAHLHRMRGMAKGKEESLEVLGRQSEELAVLALETRVGPSFCNNMELVKHRGLTGAKMRSGFVQGVRAVMGVKKKACPDGPHLNHQPLLTETEVLPWDVQVKAQAVRLAGKLRQGQTDAPKNKLAGELGKALAAAKERAKGEQMKNGFLLDALPFARQWGVQLEQPRGRTAKSEWKAAIRAGAKKDARVAAEESLRIRDEDVENGGRQANSVFVQQVDRGNLLKEAQSLREVIPSRALRAGMKNMKMGALQNAKGTQAKMEPGWASLGHDLQAGLLECTCGRGSKPRHQDAVHVLGECAFSRPVRDKVVEDMSAVVAEEGQDSDRSVWAELSDKERLKYSLTTTKIFGEGLDRKTKSAGALAWVTGMQQVDDDLEEKNSTEEGTWSALARREALYQEMGRAVDHDNAGAEEDLGQLVNGMDWLIAGL